MPNPLLCRYCSTFLPRELRVYSFPAKEEDGFCSLACVENYKLSEVNKHLNADLRPCRNCGRFTASSLEGFCSDHCWNGGRYAHY